MSCDIYLSVSFDVSFCFKCQTKVRQITCSLESGLQQADCTEKKTSKVCHDFDFTLSHCKFYSYFRAAVRAVSLVRPIPFSFLLLHVVWLFTGTNKYLSLIHI